MKQLFFSLILVNVCLLSLNAQMSQDSLIISNPKGEVKCYRDSVLLTYEDYMLIFKDYPKAFHEMKVAKFDYNTGTYIAYTGGFVFGFCIGSAISGEKIDYTWWITLGSSAVIVGVGFLIYNAGPKHQRKAIDLYNSTFRKTSLNTTKKIELCYANNGFGLIYKF